MYEVQIPWTRLGEYFGEFRANLGARLPDNQHLVRFEFVLSPYSEEGPQGVLRNPEYSLSYGEGQERFPCLDGLVEIAPEAAAASDIDGLFMEMYASLRGEFGPQTDYRLAPGVRAIVYSPNPGWKCYGVRCVYRYTHSQYWLIRYTYVDKTCCYYWVESCGSGVG